MKSGKLTIFTSYTPGAGKSYLMVSKALERLQSGEKVCFGFLNARHRIINRIAEDNFTDKNISEKYSLKMLISKSPRLVVLDEMGMYGINIDENTFVYEDIKKILDAGIDVYTTANLKKFEAANPLFKKITGIGIKKTIPDSFLEIADRIYFVDREPIFMIQDFERGTLFSKRYQNSKIMKKNFQPDTLLCYRDISLEYLKRYESKVRVVKR